MAQVIITINHREYAISCENGQEIQIMKLGRLLDEKAKSLIAALGQINENQLLAMVGLLIADELSEIKKNAIQPTAQPATDTPNTDIIDAELAECINSLNDSIKSIATKIKSV